MDLSRIVERWAAHIPAKLALHFEGADVTYAELWARIDAASKGLHVRRGERVAWLGYNSPDMLVLLFALARRGAILVPLNWRLTAAEHREILVDCSPKLLFSDRELETAAGALGIPIGRLGNEGKAVTAGEESDDVL